MLHILHLTDVAYSADQQQLGAQQGHLDPLDSMGDQRPATTAQLLQRVEKQEARAAAAVLGGVEQAAAAVEAEGQARAQEQAGADEAGEEGAVGGNKRRRQRQGAAGGMRLNQRPQPLAPSRLRRRGEGPRDSVPRFFYQLGRWPWLRGQCR